MPEYGLPDATLVNLRQILAACPVVEEAILYGSRAMGNYRPGSDIDLTLTGAGLDHGALARIAGAFSDSSIPYQVDLSIWDELTHPGLRAHIERVGVVIYSRGCSGRPV